MNRGPVSLVFGGPICAALAEAAGAGVFVACVQKRKCGLTEKATREPNLSDE
jgi:hypothetical protein